MICIFALGMVYYTFLCSYPTDLSLFGSVRQTGKSKHFGFMEFESPEVVLFTSNYTMRKLE